MTEKHPLTHNQEVARWGEATAAEYLAARGYVIVARNARTPYGEIDLVTQLGSLVVFVEVKTRTSHTYGLPEEAVNPRKLEHMMRAAEHYCGQNEIDHWQLDVIAIEGKPGTQPVITHFENAA